MNEKLLIYMSHALEVIVDPEVFRNLSIVQRVVLAGINSIDAVEGIYREHFSIQELKQKIKDLENQREITTTMRRKIMALYVAISHRQTAQVAVMALYEHLISTLIPNTLSI